MIVQLILWIIIYVVFSLQFYLICVHILALCFIYNLVSYYMSCTGMYPCQVPPSVDKEDIVYSPGFLEEKISNKTLFVFYSFICLVISDLIYPFLGTERHRGIKATHWDGDHSTFLIELIHAGCFSFSTMLWCQFSWQKKVLNISVFMFSSHILI